MVQKTSLVMTLWLFGCVEGNDPGTDPNQDADGDGFALSVDCDDGDADIHPLADEICDGIDNNCDQVIDEDAIDRLTGWNDVDEDGFGDPASEVLGCDVSHLADNADDCDDSSDAVHPGAEELCDAIDNDCDDDIDGVFLRVPEDEPTIQDAIYMSEAGDTICVSPGTYDEPFELTKRRLSIIGAAGPEETHLVLGDLFDETFITFDPQLGGDGLLAGFTIRGHDEENYSYYEPSLLRVEDDTFTFERVVFRDHVFESWDLTLAFDKPLIDLDMGELILRDAEFRDIKWVLEDADGNQTPDLGGRLIGAASSFGDDHDVRLERVSFFDNEIVTKGGAPYGFEAEGLFVRAYGGSLHMTDVEIRDNVVDVAIRGELDVDGLFIGTQSERVHVDGLTLADNELRVTVPQGYAQVLGMVRISESAGNWTDVMLERNVIDVRAKTINMVDGVLNISILSDYDWGETFSIDGLTAHHNEIRAGRTPSASGTLLTAATAGPLYLKGAAYLRHLDVRSNVVEGDISFGAGGFFETADRTLLIENSIFAGNVAGTADATLACGGGLYLDGSDGTANLRHLTVYANVAESMSATVGGGLCLDGNDGVELTVEHATSTDNLVEADDEPSTYVTGADFHTVGLSDEGWGHNNYFEFNGYGEKVSDLSVDPAFVGVSGGDPTGWDLHLTSDSELVDAGSNLCDDPDGTICDIGAYGGPGGDW